jgi:hypothetical protein
VEKIIQDPHDPSYPFRTLEAWRKDFEARLAAAKESSRLGVQMRVEGAPAVGLVTEQGLRLFEAKRRAEGKKAAEIGLEMERIEIAVPKLPEA